MKLCSKTSASLIELLVVISVISILAAVILPVVHRAYVTSRNRMMWTEYFHNLKIMNPDVEWYLTNTPYSAFCELHSNKNYGDVEKLEVEMWRKMIRKIK